MKHHAALQTLQNQFHGQRQDSVEDRFYELACDLQDIAVFGNGLSLCETQELQYHINENRNVIRNIFKRKK